MATIVSIVLGLASAGLMTAAMFWIGDYYRGTQPDLAEAGQRKLQELRAAEQEQLEGYGWINRTDGVVRIPVDRAMELLVKESQPREASPPKPQGEQPSSE
jgi:hypothetical protein